MPSKTYEDAFIEALQQHDPRLENPPEPKALLEFLQEKTRHRWRVYADGYALRITEALSDNILDMASALYGKGFLKQLLFEYISAQPPTASVMPDLLCNFAVFLDDHASHAQSPDLADFVRLAYQRWEVLIGEDPEPSQDLLREHEEALDRVFLQKNHGFIESDYPLFHLWTEAERRSQDPDPEKERLVPTAAEAVLTYKSSPVAIEMLLIVPTLIPFIRNLSQGKSLNGALALLELDTSEDEAAFIALMAKLRQTSAFAVISLR